MHSYSRQSINQLLAEMAGSLNLPPSLEYGDTSDNIRFEFGKNVDSRVVPMQEGRTSCSLCIVLYP